MIIHVEESSKSTQVKGVKVIKVQFIHGLESGPSGAKVQHMRQSGFVVIAPDMQMSVKRLDRHNSVIRNLLRLPEARLATGMSVAGGALLAMGQDRSYARKAMVLLGGAGVIAGMRHRAWMKQALVRSFENCVELQEEAIRAHQPDIIVGSSWGGAVTMELIRRGAWTGPAILLAPAYHSVGLRAGWRDLDVREEELRMKSRSQRIALIHDPTDDVVPYAHSLDLVGHSDIDFKSVSGGGHRLLGYLDDGRLDSLIKKMVM